MEQVGNIGKGVVKVRDKYATRIVSNTTICLGLLLSCLARLPGLNVRGMIQQIVSIMATRRAMGHLRVLEILTQRHSVLSLSRVLVGCQGYQRSYKSRKRCRFRCCQRLVAIKRCGILLRGSVVSQTNMI